MTTTAAAAERLRAGKYGMPIFDPTHFLSRQMMQDLATIRDAYLAEHPADDATPVTPDWLKSIGFKEWLDQDDEPDDDGFDLWIRMQDEIGWECRLAYQSNGFYAVRMCEDEECGAAESVELLNSRNRTVVITRGTVRSLARVLGIPLTGEPSNA